MTDKDRWEFMCAAAGHEASKTKPNPVQHGNHPAEAGKDVHIHALTTHVTNIPPLDTSLFRKELDAALDHYFRWHVLTLASWLLLVLSLTSNCNGRG